MGRLLHDAFPHVRVRFAEADEALGFDLSRLCFTGPEDDLQRTENTQPGILTVSVAAAEVVQAELGVTPAFAAGHSLGEYSALVVAGSLAFADAVRLVRLRGRFMQEAVPEGVGAMGAVIGLSVAEIHGICAEAMAGAAEKRLICQVANENGAGQVVLSGHAEAVDVALKLARGRGAKLCKRLPVSAPFHCALMAPAAERLREELAKIPVAAPRLTVLANIDAAPYPSTEEAIRDRLYRQVTGTVRWEATMKSLAGLGVTKAVETGPGKVLFGLLKHIDPKIGLFHFGEPDHHETVRAGLVSVPNDGDGDGDAAHLATEGQVP